MMIDFSPEQDQYLQLAQTRAYYQCMRDGVIHHAHWRDGVQYVGTASRTLKAALKHIDQLEADPLTLYQKKFLWGFTQ